MNSNFVSNIQVLEPCFVRVKSASQSIQAKAINYCFLYRENDTTYTIYSHFLRNKGNEVMKLKDIINTNADDIELNICDDLILSSNKKPKINAKDIFIICKTNDGTVYIPRDKITIITEKNSSNND